MQAEYFNYILIYIENTSIISYSRCIAVVTITARKQKKVVAQHRQ